MTPKMRVIFRTLLRKHFTLELEAITTVKQLKAKLMEVEGLPVHCQRLIFEGTWLECESKSLQDYGIHEGCLVHLSVVQGLKRPILKITRDELLCPCMKVEVQ
uniref:Ubiquitin-like domain-containing protein n=1 Tax=Physcomitrium patens TaxID=3218 RepID=A0A2K1KCS7_PHYPA|nr:hypothetical protein PHYPA_010773 [Physcomitrium patens]